MSEDDITLLVFQPVRNMKGQVVRPGFRLYYYQGNVFGGTEYIDQIEETFKKVWKRFYKANKERVLRDRAHPNYRTLMELDSVLPPTD